MIARPKKIVIMGGGTGTHMLLSGLKKYPADIIDLCAVVTSADSGGSTGRLRDEFGTLPMGDVRMALVGLAEDNSSHLLRELFLYRFSKGEGLKGHNFGNLLLTALTDILGSEEKAIEHAARILRVRGKVLPVTLADVHLVAEYERGVTVYGEAHIDEPCVAKEYSTQETTRPHTRHGNISNLRIEPASTISPRVQKEIERADMIVLGPGDLYTSTLANVVVHGVPQALVASKGKLVYIMNLMTRQGQTIGFTAQDYIREAEKYIGRSFDHILINTTPISREFLEAYEKEGEFPVENNFNTGEDPRIIEGDFLSETPPQVSSADTLRRSLVRHDTTKLAPALVGLI